jgi:hypothetical protein
MSNILGWPKSFRISVFWGIFYKMLNKPHNIFNDFEDEMATPEKKFLRNFTLFPPYVHEQRISGKSNNSNFLYIKLYKRRTIIFQSIVRRCQQPEMPIFCFSVNFLVILHKGGQR